MSIKPLPGDVVAQIKSSVVITSLNGVICGLVKNSLDAGATKINLNVDYTRGNCSIEDNGAGVPPSEFKQDGGLGHLHYTSKFPPHPGVHGKHGLFLASVASLSLLSITSHHRDFHSHNSLSLHNSKVIARNTPCLPEQKVLTFSHGTRVIVRDLFGSMPVRVKHRALQADKSTFSRDWDRLLLDVVALLVAWPGSVSVSIREASSRQGLTLKTGSEPQRWVNDTCRLLHQASLCASPDTSDWVAIGASSPKISVDGYVYREPAATKRVQFISLDIEPLSNERRCNVLYEEVNKVFADSSFGVVEEESNPEGAPTNSDRDAFTNQDLKARKGVDRWPMFFLKLSPAVSQTRRSLAIDDVLDDRQTSLALITDLLRAMFYEFLKKNHCRPRKVTLSTKITSRKEKASSTSPRVENIASTGSVTRLETVQSPRLIAANAPVRKTPRLELSDRTSESPFAAWSKIKSGQPLQSYPQSAPPRSAAQSTSTTTSQKSRDTTPGHNSTEPSKSSTPTESSRPPLYDANGKLTRKPFDDIDPRKPRRKRSDREVEADAEIQSQAGIMEQPLSSNHIAQDETLEWINPATKMVTTINSRTGFTMAPKPLTLNKRAFEDEHTRMAGGSKEQTPETPKTAPWVRDLVNKWKNPVFELAEAPIPRLPDVPETLGLDLKPAGHQCHHGHVTFSGGNRHETAAMGLLGRLSKETLRKAQLIAQVDRKFIFTKASLDQVHRDEESSTELSGASSVLILIDQHAADERCRVEALMQAYFKPATCDDDRKYWKAVTEKLPKPVQFELPRQDKDVLVRFQQYFEYWGINYDVESSAGTSQSKKRSRTTKFKVIVQSLPPAILERCRTEPRLLAELIRKEAWKLNDEDGFVRQATPRLISAKDFNDSVPVWVSLFHRCPQGIVELINSRSCRSAIMFNDPLTLEQCSDLLERLVQCAFPFQCAHGRPSMVPLVDLRDGAIQLGSSPENRDAEGRGESFGWAFKMWKEARG